jgi:hypothetical protein
MEMLTSPARVIVTPGHLVVQVDLDGSASTAIFRQPSFQLFYIDDVPTGSLLVSSC